MRSFAVLWVGILPCLSGCESRPASPPALTSVEARDALVRGIREANNDDLKPLAEELESLPAERMMDYRESCFHVRADLAECRAGITVFFDNRRITYEVKFALTENGTWRATISPKWQVRQRPEAPVDPGDPR